MFMRHCYTAVFILFIRSSMIPKSREALVRLLSMINFTEAISPIPLFSRHFLVSRARDCDSDIAIQVLSVAEWETVSTFDKLNEVCDLDSGAH